MTDKKKKMRCKKRAADSRYRRACRRHRANRLMRAKNCCTRRWRRGREQAALAFDVTLLEEENELLEQENDLLKEKNDLLEQENDLLDGEIESLEEED